MGPGGDGPGGDDFKECQAEWESTYGVQFATSLADLPEPKAVTQSSVVTVGPAMVSAT